MDTCCLGCCGNVKRRREQNPVNDVNNPVRGLDISKGNVGVSNSNKAIAHAKFEVVAVDHVGKHTIRDGASGNFSRENVVQ